MLLEQLHKYTPEDHPDFAALTQALQSVSSAATHNNEEIRRREMREQIIQIMTQFENSSRVNLLDTPSRVFLKESIMQKLCRRGPKDFKFWLFNDKLLYGEPASTGKYSVNRDIDLRQCRVSVVENVANTDKAFKIESPSKSFIVWARHSQEKIEWLEAISTAMQRLRDQYQQETGKIAPVWTPDSAVSACEVCEAKFTVTFRRHHCRQCGTIVCSNCSNNRWLIAHIDPKHPVRVCNECYGELRKSSTDQPPALTSSPSTQTLTPSSPSPQRPPSPTELKRAASVPSFSLTSPPAGTGVRKPVPTSKPKPPPGFQLQMQSSPQSYQQPNGSAPRKSIPVPARVPPPPPPARGRQETLPNSDTDPDIPSSPPPAAPTSTPTNGTTSLAAPPTSPSTVANPPVPPKPATFVPDPIPSHLLPNTQAYIHTYAGGEKPPPPPPREQRKNSAPGSPPAPDRPASISSPKSPHRPYSAQADLKHKSNPKHYSSPSKPKPTPKPKPYPQPLSAVHTISESRAQSNGSSPEASSSPPGTEVPVSRGTGPDLVFTYEELKSQDLFSLPPGVDITTREMLLSNDEFEHVFGCTKQQFNALPKWKQNNQKKQLGLF